jgi:hypothetical protein
VRLSSILYCTRKVNGPVIHTLCKLGSVTVYSLCNTTTYLTDYTLPSLPTRDSNILNSLIFCHDSRHSNASNNSGPMISAIFRVRLQLENNRSTSADMHRIESMSRAIWLRLGYLCFCRSHQAIRSSTHLTLSLIY